MVELVVGSERRQRAHAHAVREEDLRGAVDPDEWVEQPEENFRSLGGKDYMCGWDHISLTSVLFLDRMFGLTDYVLS